MNIICALSLYQLVTALLLLKFTIVHLIKKKINQYRSFNFRVMKTVYWLYLGIMATKREEGGNKFFHSHRNSLVYLENSGMVYMISLFYLPCIVIVMYCASFEILYRRDYVISRSRFILWWVAFPQKLHFAFIVLYFGSFYCFFLSQCMGLFILKQYWTDKFASCPLSLFFFLSGF